jgi:hypothetical protein
MYEFAQDCKFWHAKGFLYLKKEEKMLHTTEGNCNKKADLHRFRPELGRPSGGKRRGFSRRGGAGVTKLLARELARGGGRAAGGAENGSGIEAKPERKALKNSPIHVEVVGKP